MWGKVVDCGEKCVTLAREFTLLIKNWPRGGFREPRITQMSMRFLGTTEARIDAKGRAFLPATFRRVLQASGEERVVMRRDVFQPCIVLYPETVWNEQMDHLRARLNRWNQAHQAIFRQFVADAEVLVIDSTGRILLPKRHLERLGADRDIAFIGMGDTIEIWSATRAAEPFVPADEFGEALQSLMGGTTENADETAQK